MDKVTKSFKYWKFFHEKLKRNVGVARLKILPYNITSEQYYFDSFMFKASIKAIKEHLYYKLQNELKNKEMVFIPGGNQEVYLSKVINNGIDLIDEAGNLLKDMKSVIPFSELKGKTYSDSYSGRRGKIIEVYERQNQKVLVENTTGSMVFLSNLDSIIL